MFYVLINEREAISWPCLKGSKKDLPKRRERLHSAKDTPDKICLLYNMMYWVIYYFLNVEITQNYLKHPLGESNEVTKTRGGVCIRIYFQDSIEPEHYLKKDEYSILQYWFLVEKRGSNFIDITYEAWYVYIWIRNCPLYFFYFKDRKRRCLKL